MSNEFMRREIAIRPRYLVCFAVLLVFAFFLSYAVHNSRVRKLNVEMLNLEGQVQEAYKQTELLEQKLIFRGTDDYVIRAARETYGYLFAGETRYMMEGMIAPEYLAPNMPVAFVNTTQTGVPVEVLPNPTPEIIVGK